MLDILCLLHYICILSQDSNNYIDDVDIGDEDDHHNDEEEIDDEEGVEEEFDFWQF